MTLTVRWAHKTKDSGKNWSAMKIPSKASYPCGIFFLNSEVGWVNFGLFGEQELFSTIDGGENWKKLSTIPENYEIRSMYWLSSGEGWIAGYFHNVEIDAPRHGRGAILRTSDGGQTWIEVEVDKDVPFFDKIYFSDSQNGWLVSRDSIYITSNGGEVWKKSFTLSPLKD